MRKEYTKPTLSIEEYDITTEIAATPISTVDTKWGETVNADDIWTNV